MATPHKAELTLINGKEYMTRHWYMNCAKDLDGSERHRMYYAQFVTPAVLAFVKGHFGKSQWALMAEAYRNGDHYLNECSKLHQWDACDVRHLVGRLVTDCVYMDVPRGTMYWSPGENTCITKEAARMLIESGEYPQ